MSLNISGICRLHYQVFILSMEKGIEQLVTTKMLSEIISIRFLTESTYVLRFQRNGLEFQAGQYIVIGPQGSKQKREYSIYSPVTAPYLEVIIKEVDNGFLSKKLKLEHPGEIIEVEGPFGYFVIDEKKGMSHFFFVWYFVILNQFLCNLCMFYIYNLYKV